MSVSTISVPGAMQLPAFASNAVGMKSASPSRGFVLSESVALC